jgi:pyrrolidone-carboxylate peptidase
VASSRPDVCVERLAVRVDVGQPDVDGAVDTGLLGADEVRASLDTGALARALGGVASDDAGRYVCNAWLHHVASALDVPVGFVHVPASGIPVERMVDGLRVLVERLSGDGARV